MNKDNLNNKAVNLSKQFNGKIKEIVVLSIVAFLLIFAAWQIFHTNDGKSTSTIQPTAIEMKVMRLLEEIDGVGEAEVIVCETEDGIQSVVVVCEGANNLRVVMDVQSAVATALGTNEKMIRVYLKKE